MTHLLERLVSGLPDGSDRRPRSGAASIAAAAASAWTAITMKLSTISQSMAGPAVASQPKPTSACSPPAAIIGALDGMREAAASVCVKQPLRCV